MWYARAPIPQNMRMETGKTGEDLAENFLRANGYKILERNKRTRFGEIDIIAKENGQIVFVEVKTRTSDLYGLPQESVTKRKLMRIQRLAQIYLREKSLQNKSFRVDVISIQLQKMGGVSNMQHIKDVA